MFVYLIIAYLIGSLSPSILVARYLGFQDPRTQGSGNAGATNVSRMAGKKIGALVFLLDFTKGWVPVWLMQHWGCGPMLTAVVTVCLVLGHIFPFYHRFRGGKGVATLIGCFIAWQWANAAVAALIWSVVVGLSGYVSLASVVTIGVLPLVTYWLSPSMPSGVVVLLSSATLMVILAHRHNLVRLIKGEELSIRQQAS